MKTIEFEATIDSDTIIIPEAHQSSLRGKEVTVTIRYEEKGKSADDHYTKGYDQKDSLYDAY